ncbi:MAG: transcriptional repressor LexA [Actinomycetota bacterium]
MTPTASPSTVTGSAPTARQRRILDFIARTVRDRGYPPTVREIGEAVGLTSSSSVHAQLANLERLGLLHRDPTKPRAIGLAEAGSPSRAAEPEDGTVPLLGRIAAGAPVLAAEHVEDRVRVPGDFLRGGEHFALRVAGDSMVGAGILDGDLVVVRRQDDARDGDVVAAILPGPGEDEATVKRLRRTDGRVLLVPENPALRPFEMPEGGRLAGVVTGVLRKL